ncbi:MAG TPA: glyoxylate/hydroxypyruvate reductase A [Burkholderiales bacterium]|nr:glyoxylate/hydroxypyruvate reductase A [Burkholderiales bacterium]
MSLLFYSDTDAPEPWREALARELPEMEFRLWPDVGEPARVSYALVWRPRPGLLASLPNLKAILSLGAGVDHLLLDPHLPDAVPIVRMVDAGLAVQMSEYALYGVLHFHRSMQRYAEQQQRALWRQLPAVPAAQRTVGVMGLGVLGSDFIRKLVPLGFSVLGWSRTPRRLENVTSFHGPEGLSEFLGQSEILVNFLPLTADTAGVLSASTFARLPRGACIINIARGAHLNERDLLAALEQGQLGGAMLDVFQHEPLPPEHPFWHHPRIVVTPHVAAQAIAELMVSQVIDNIRCIERGEPPLGLVDRGRGY